MSKVPKRIISIVPSQTELLYDLGLRDEVIGITKFCVHPNGWFKTKTRVGGTKNVNIEKVRELKPDLIIANKEENVKEQVEALQEIAPVYTSDIATLEEALEMIMTIGQLTRKTTKALAIINQIRSEFDELSRYIIQHRNLKTAYLIWKDPYMVAGGNTFINDLMVRSCFDNIFKHTNRYPEVFIASTALGSRETKMQNNYPVLDSERQLLLTEENCELLLLSSEPYPFKQKHVEELQTQLPGTKIVLVDGEMFSWYGSRLIHSAQYFKKLFEEITHPF